MTEQWQELKETIIEMRDNDGTGTQQEVCKFLANLMDVLEKQISNSEKTGRWIKKKSMIYCSECCDGFDVFTLNDSFKYCPNCGAKMGVEE